jgi:hypothetical protein
MSTGIRASFMPRLPGRVALLACPAVFRNHTDRQAIRGTQRSSRHGRMPLLTCTAVRSYHLTMFPSPGHRRVALLAC